MKRLHEWRTCRLGDVTQTFSGGTPNRSHPDYYGGSIPWIKSGELNQKWISQTEEFITEAGLANSATKIVPAGATLIALYGATAGVVGRTRIAAAINQAVLAVIPDKSKINDDFLAYVLNHIGAALLRVVQGAQPNLNAGLVKDSEIDLPPLPEQQKIADILGTWDEALEKLDALIAAKARRKQALMQQLLTGGLQLRSFKNRPWKSLRMSDLLERVFRPAEIDETVSLPLVSIRRRLGGLFRRPDVMASEYKTQDLHFLKAGDFVISKRQVAHGAWSIVEPEFDSTLVSKEYAILVNRAPDKLDMRFFAWLAQTPRMVRLSRVASTGVHIEKLIFDPDVFLREKIRVPGDIAEQRAIAAVLDTADAELRLLRQQRTALDHQKRGLMQQLLTGQKRVRV